MYMLTKDKNDIESGAYATKIQMVSQLFSSLLTKMMR